MHHACKHYWIAGCDTVLINLMFGIIFLKRYKRVLRKEDKSFEACIIPHQMWQRCKFNNKDYYQAIMTWGCVWRMRK
ncbi:hypothetical protein P8452_60639 [Trifolium repens]|nr:hypothetical protein P8452_60639 [Trifolium repens]